MLKVSDAQYLAIRFAYNSKYKGISYRNRERTIQVDEVFDFFLFSARTANDIQLKTSVFTNVETTLIGQNLTIVYLVSSRLQYCRFSDPSNNDLLLLPNREYQSFNGTLYSYNGAGFAAGECGITVYNVTEQHNGNWTCIVGLPGEIGEQRATFSVPIKGKYTASIPFV